jgi:hypothetical protein
MIERLVKAHGDLMTLLHVSIDHVPAEGLLLAFAISVIWVVVRAIALIKASPEARGVPAPAEQGMLPVPAGRMSMIVVAQDRTSAPLHLRFTLSDPTITLLRIEIANQLDKRAECAECVKEGTGVFVTTVVPKVVQRWYNANPYWDGETKQLPIRASFMTNGQAVCRTIWVRMRPRMIANSGLPDVNDFAWFLEGPCSSVRPILLPVRANQTSGTTRRAS